VVEERREKLEVEGMRREDEISQSTLLQSLQDTIDNHQLKNKNLGRAIVEGKREVEARRRETFDLTQHLNSLSTKESQLISKRQMLRSQIEAANLSLENIRMGIL